MRAYCRVSAPSLRVATPIQRLSRDPMRFWRKGNGVVSFWQISPTRTGPFQQLTGSARQPRRQHTCVLQPSVAPGPQAPPQVRAWFSRPDLEAPSSGSVLGRPRGESPRRMRQISGSSPVPPLLFRIAWDGREQHTEQGACGGWKGGPAAGGWAGNTPPLAEAWIGVCHCEPQCGGMPRWRLTIETGMRRLSPGDFP